MCYFYSTSNLGVIMTLANLIIYDCFQQGLIFPTDKGVLCLLDWVSDNPGTPLSLRPCCLFINMRCPPHSPYWPCSTPMCCPPNRAVPEQAWASCHSGCSAISKSTPGACAATTACSRSRTRAARARTLPWLCMSHIRAGRT